MSEAAARAALKEWQDGANAWALEHVENMDPKVREAHKKFHALGRPPASACRCQSWPCPCACHRGPF